jgi:kynurenine formamidase
VAAGLAGLAPLAVAGPARAETAPGGIPEGWEAVDPRTARRVPLTLSLRDGVPLYPGDPPFRWHVAVDTRTPAHDDGGYLLEQVDSLGTHTASHVSAPVHFVLGGARLDQLDERFALMPLAVLDVRERTARDGADLQVGCEDLRAWEAEHGRLPRGGCVLLLTGAAQLWARGSGEDSPYVTTPVPGLAGGAVDWLFTQRGIIATGADSLGPDATSDARLEATTRTLVHGGITLENVGPGLARMRPRGDWIAVNGNRPPFSGFQTGFTGFTLR